VSLSNFAENEIADWLAANGAPSAVANVYVKLHTGDPGEDGTGNPAGETDRMEATFGAASGGVATSDADITWTAVSTTEQYQYVSLWDNASAGNCLGSGALTAPVSVTANDNFTIPAGDLTITIT
jgi:hypothetical protein